MRRPISFAAAVLLTAAAPLAAQQTRSISAGMTMEEVRATFGAPGIVRDTEGWTYFFYSNRCLPRCGTDDTVFFRGGEVVAAVLHSPSRQFNGPAAAQAISALGPAPAAADGGPSATVSGLRVRTADGAEQSVNLGVMRGRAPQPAEADELTNGGSDVGEQLVEPTVEERPTPPVDRRPPPAAEPPPPNARQTQQQREEGLSPNTIRPRQ